MAMISWDMLAIGMGLLSLVEVAVFFGAWRWPWKPSGRSIFLSAFATFCAAMAANPSWVVVVEPTVWVALLVVSVVMWTRVLRHARKHAGK